MSSILRQVSFFRVLEVSHSHIFEYISYKSLKVLCIICKQFTKADAILMIHMKYKPLSYDLIYKFTNNTNLHYNPLYFGFHFKGESINSILGILLKLTAESIFNPIKKEGVFIPSDIGNIFSNGEIKIRKFLAKLFPLLDKDSPDILFDDTTKHYYRTTHTKTNSIIYEWTIIPTSHKNKSMHITFNNIRNKCIVNIFKINIRTFIF